jgi:RNA polymerase sigma-32 factor
MPPRKSKRPADDAKEPEGLLPSETSSSLVPTDPLRGYLAKIRPFPLLTAEQEKEFAVRYHQTGDREAFARLVTGNLRLVVRIAVDFRRAFTNLLDLIQEGNIGLLQAIERYDPFRGTKLSTYATWWIRAYIIKYLLDNWSIVKFGTTNLRRKLFFNLKKEKENLEKMGFDTGPKLLAERFGATEQDVIDVGRAIDERDVSLDAPLPMREKGTYHDRVPADHTSQEDRIAREQLQEVVREKLAGFQKQLKDRERAVFRDRLMAEEPATLQELADRMGITREGVRQIETRVKRKIEKMLKSDPRLAGELGKL